MDDVNASFLAERPRRMEVLVGSERRRRWPDSVKAQIVAETLAPGVSISAVARRYDLLPSQVRAWRNAARDGGMALPGEPTFAQVVATSTPISPKTASPGPAPARGRHARSGLPLLEIEVGSMLIRVNAGAEAAMIERVIRALKVGT